MQAESHLCKKRVRDNKEDNQSECPNNTKRMKLNDQSNDDKVIKSHVLQSLFNNKESENNSKQNDFMNRCAKWGTR